MSLKKHVNLLYNKEIIERRSKIRTMLRYATIIVGVVTLVGCVVVTLLLFKRKSVLADTSKSLSLLSAQLETKRSDAIAARVINSKAILMQKFVENELPLDEYYASSLAFLPKDVVDNYLETFDINPTGEGIFQFTFDDFKKLDNFIGYIESKKSDNSYKAYKIDQITVNEGSPSASMVRLKIQFK